MGPHAGFAIQNLLWRPAFRVEALPSYKTHRVAATEDEENPIAPQEELGREVLRAGGERSGAATLSGAVGLAGGMGGFILPIMFGFTVTCCPDARKVIE